MTFEEALGNQMLRHAKDEGKVGRIPQTVPTNSGGAKKHDRPSDDVIIWYIRRERRCSIKSIADRYKVKEKTASEILRRLAKQGRLTSTKNRFGKLAYSVAT